MKTALFWIALVALLVQALGYGIPARVEWERRFLEQPMQEEMDAAGEESAIPARVEWERRFLEQPMQEEMDAAEEESTPENLIINEEDIGTPDETENNFMREIEDLAKPVDDRMAYNQQSQRVRRPVHHASDVAFQSLYTKDYIGCDRSPRVCNKSTCPGLYMEDIEWNYCYEDVLRIYRKSGPGLVKAGDIVGFYYPRGTRKWFGCTGRYCIGQAPCPGTPTIQYGMQTENKWIQCYGEVFRIFAKGRALGATIYTHDNILLQYIRENKWVGFGTTYIEKHTCPGSVLPPPPDRHDVCRTEAIELWGR